MASERARVAAAKDKEVQEAATVEGIMQSDKELYSHFLEEEPTSQAQFMGARDVEGAPQSMQGFMGSGERHRTSDAPGLEGVRLMGETKRAETEATALAESRRVTGEAATQNAATRKLEAENRAFQLAEVKRMDISSRKAIRGTLQSEFKGLYQKITETGLNFDNIDGASARMIGEYMIQSANEVENDIDKLQSRLDGYDTLMMNLHLKNQATAAKSVGGMDAEAKKMMDVNTLTITDSITKARETVRARLEKLREEIRFMKEGPIVETPVQQNEWNLGAPEEGYYNENPWQAQQPYAQQGTSLMGPRPGGNSENPSLN
jgi:hypothetical protein